MFRIVLMMIVLSLGSNVMAAKPEHCTQDGGLTNNAVIENIVQGSIIGVTAVLVVATFRPGISIGRYAGFGAIAGITSTSMARAGECQAWKGAKT